MPESHNHERELGEINAKLGAIAQDLGEVKEAQRADHVSITKLTEAVATLVAKEAMRHEPRPASSAQGAPGVMGAGAAAGALAGAAANKIMTWLGAG